MKKISLLLICLGVFSLNGAAQLLKFSDIYVYGGAGATTADPLSANEMRKLESGLNLPNLPQSNNGYYLRSSIYTSQVGMMAAWNVRNTRNRIQKIRVGFSAGQYEINYNNSQSENNSYRIDTLVSGSTGRTSYVDSFNLKNIYAYHDAKMFNFSIDYLRTINPRNKLSTYVGAGLNVGVTLSNSLTGNFSEYNYVNEPNGYSQFGPNYDMNNNYEYENYYKELSTASSFRPYSLVGLNYKLSKRSAFLRHINVFAEYKMGLEFSMMQELNTAAGFYYGAQGGLKVSL